MRKLMAMVLLAPLAAACSAPANDRTAKESEQGRLTPQSDPSIGAATSADAEKANYLSNYVRADTIVRSFQDADGRWVDCVDVNQQPGMLTPETAGQKLEPPPPVPDGFASASPPLSGQYQPAQLNGAVHANEIDGFGSVRHCEPGTVPIRRTTAEDLQRFATLNDFYAKSPNRAQTAASLRDHALGSTPSIAGFEYGAQNQWVTNWGFQSWINVWNPFVQNTVSEHSLSQIWVANWYNVATLGVETAEAGWTVNPLVFGDTKTRLFIYWTPDGYVHGCYDLMCAGFVQTNNSVMLGDYFNSGSISSIGGAQYDFQIAWEKNSSTSSWWLLFQGSWLGYLPASLYSHGMQTQANFTQYGGEVYNSEPGGSHTQTWMGSGVFASGGYQQAAYQRHLQYIDLTFHTIDVSPTAFVTNSNCYSMVNGFDGTGDGWGAYEFLGGRGGWLNSSCP
jgi:hypothetical protein